MPTYQCPVCQGEMKVIPGQQMNPRDGVTIYCPHRTCPAQEVSGHGPNEKGAWEVITQKFPKK